MDERRLVRLLSVNIITRRRRVFHPVTVVDSKQNYNDLNIIIDNIIRRHCLTRRIKMRYNICCIIYVCICAMHSILLSCIVKRQRYHNYKKHERKKMLGNSKGR